MSLSQSLLSTKGENIWCEVPPVLPRDGNEALTEGVWFYMGQLLWIVLQCDTMQCNCIKEKVWGYTIPILMMQIAEVCLCKRERLWIAASLVKCACLGSWVYWFLYVCWILPFLAYKQLAKQIYAQEHTSLCGGPWLLPSADSPSIIAWRPSLGLNRAAGLADSWASPLEMVAGICATSRSSNLCKPP